MSNTPTRHFMFDLVHEGVVCLSCGAVLISYNRHDYKTCGCRQSTMVDGGQIDYVRLGGKDLKLVRQVLITPIMKTKSGKRSRRKLKTFRQVFGRK